MALPIFNLYGVAVLNAFWTLWRYVNLNLLIHNFTNRLEGYGTMRKSEITLHTIMIFLVTTAFLLLVYDDGVRLARCFYRWSMKKCGIHRMQRVYEEQREREVDG